MKNYNDNNYDKENNSDINNTNKAINKQRNTKL